jgi:membrane protease YdiL (CAAX protease family)
LYHAPRRPVVEPIVAGAIVAIAVASYLLAMGLVPRELGFVVAQLALLAVASVAAAIAHPARPLAVPPSHRSERFGLWAGALGLCGARPRYFVAAIAIGTTAWYLNAWLVAWLVERFALPSEQIQHLKGLVDRPATLRAIAAFALLPAVCEELVFRGVLARSLGRRHALATAALISALAFSAYHLSPVQALPTFTLGLALGAIAIRADSVLPAMLAHGLNNGMAIAMSRGELATAAGWLDRHPVVALIGCATATASGLVIAVRRPRGQSSPGI